MFDKKDSDQALITIENAGKWFRLCHRKRGHADTLFSNITRNSSMEEYWALRNIDMEVKKGRIVGVIGRNGAGKSTLLNLLAGIFPPSEGKVSVKGRISSILSLGAGFKKELSGKENIFLNGLILGMSNNEISRKFDEIVEFSELGEFIDAPLNAYSQGMLLRLGFSVAIHVDFDILLIDEVISVGDISFEKKCYEKIIDFKREMKTMLISAHNLDIIERISDEIYLLENGKVAMTGDPEEIISYYKRLVADKRFSRNR